MNKKQRNIRNRLLVFFIGIPSLFALLVGLPHYNHAAMALIAIVVSSVATVELSQLFHDDFTNFPGRTYIIPALGAAMPALWYLEGSGYIPVNTAITAAIGIIAGILGLQAFRRNPAVFPHIKSLVSTLIMLLLYPGLFLAHLIRIGTLPMSSHLLVLFVITVYLNDSAAYAGGMLFGKGNGGLLPISPNKSIAGFISGLFASVLVMTSASLLYVDLFPRGTLVAAFFGLCIGCIAIIGDLAESAIKRSAAQKDSGSIIPGRGGLLDSIDSLAFAAPFFYYGYRFLFL